MCLTAWKPAPLASGARSQVGLRAAAAGGFAADLMPSLMAVKPCGVRYFSPLRAGSPGDESRGPSRATTPRDESPALRMGMP